jgi:hypothetical protein
VRRKTRSEKWPDLMGVEFNSNPIEPEKSTDEGRIQPDRRPPHDRPGELGAPSRAESRDPAVETSKKVPDAATGTTDDHKLKDTPATAEEASENGETDTAPPDGNEQRRTDREPGSPSDSFKQRPSYGNFTNLAEEFDARAKSREQAKRVNSQLEEAKPSDKPCSPDFAVDDKSLGERIDPEVDDANAGDSAETELEPAGDRTITALDEGENDTRSRADRFRAKAHAGSETLLGKVTSSVNKGVEVFGPRPTGQETRTPHGGPEVGDVPHSGIDPGTAAAGMLAMGILGAELIRKIRKTRGRDTK